MRKTWYAGIAGIALLAATLMALPGNGREKKTPGLQAWVSEQTAAELERLEQKIQAGMERLQSLLEQQQARIEEHRARMEEQAGALDEETGQLLAEHAERCAEREAQIAEQHARHFDHRRHPEEMVELWVGDEPLVWASEGESGWLGVTIAEVTAEKAKELKLPVERGVLIREVEPESPAAKAGLKAGDVLTEFGGQRVEGTVQFRRMVRETPEGRNVQLTVWRDGRSQNLSVQLGSLRERVGSRVRAFAVPDFNFKFDLPKFDFRASRSPRLGIEADDIGGQLGAYFGVPENEGVLVREVIPGSPAEKAGLKAGDVITKVEGERVRNRSELRDKLREKREQKAVSLGVIRKGAEVSVSVEIEQPKPPERRRVASRRIAL